MARGIQPARNGGKLLTRPCFPSGSEHLQISTLCAAQKGVYYLIARWIDIEMDRKARRFIYKMKAKDERVI